MWREKGQPPCDQEVVLALLPFHREQDSPFSILGQDGKDLLVSPCLSVLRCQLWDGRGFLTKLEKANGGGMGVTSGGMFEKVPSQKPQNIRGHH